MIFPLQGNININELECRCTDEIVAGGGTKLFEGLKKALEDCDSESKTNTNDSSKDSNDDKLVLVLLLSDGQDTTVTTDGLVSSLHDIIASFRYFLKFIFVHCHFD